MGAGEAASAGAGAGEAASAGAGAGEAASVGAGGAAALGALPYRGTFGEPRPPELAGLRLPPGKMPSHDGLRPLKAWRYVGVYGPDLMLCAAVVRIGPARQSFWAVWDRERLDERTSLRGTGVQLRLGRLMIPELRLDIAIEETFGIEAICPTGDSYAWTRKQGGIRAWGEMDGRRIDSHAIIDDTAAYYERHTRWRWSAGVGTSSDGRELAWNLVDGVNDPPSRSERTLWIDGEAHEVPRCVFAPDLSRVDALRFTAEATRERADNLLLVRSRYRQPFGTFDGELPGGLTVAQGYGVMEDHEVWW